MTVTRRTVVLRAIAASAACVVPAGAGPGVERAAAATRTGDAGTGPVADHTLGEWKSLVGSELTVSVARAWS
ncbi:hypothetical protein E4K10_43810 [Streptomyces sp. T1317-0309]|nr:hypothetical protein E4K10_43810 [Streptomyces sp. T1317-0309]